MFVFGIGFTLLGIVMLIAGSRMSAKGGDDGLLRPGLRIGGPLLALLGIVAVLSCTFAIINPGFVGVKVVFGSVSPTALPEGFHFVEPWAKVVPVEVRTAKMQHDYSCASSDQQNVTVTMAINFSPDPAAVPRLYSEVGLDYQTRIIEPASMECLKAQISLYKVGEILSKRALIKGQVSSTLSTWLHKYGLRLTEVSLANVAFSAEYDKAVEAKQIQEQVAEKALYELETAQTKAKEAKAQAEGTRDAAIEAARGASEARRLTGIAEAQYVREVGAALAANPRIVDLELVKAWKEGGSQVPATLITDGRAHSWIQIAAGKPTNSSDVGTNGK